MMTENSGTLVANKKTNESKVSMEATMTSDISKYRYHTNLTDARLGTRVTFVTDDWFAEANRMLNPAPPEWKEGVYDDNGKWMDGWESRRKRSAGFDYAIVKLGVPGLIEAIDIDTAFFTGNYPPSASVEGCFLETGEPDETTVWTKILQDSSLKGNSHNLFECSVTDQPWTHLKLNIFPDGGVARFRCYGRPYKNWAQHSGSELTDLASVLNGGRAIACSDEHYGTISNLLNPGRGVNMGDGWETARRRTPGYDWAIIALGHPGKIEEVLIDTCHFKGNFPDSCSIQAGYVEGGTDDQLAAQSLYWEELLPSQKLTMDSEHHFRVQLNQLGRVSHIRLNIFPDGGVSRIRVLGTTEE